ncbi:MAG TPA: glycosyltransferase family 2 protein [Leptospiraceae bacterium]|nr:glycosyltransferase family 2 protein [Leptospiraceae bacterium]
MFVSGFTFIRNAIKYDYPAEASIRSLLPLVDELVVCLGNSDDDTEGLIRRINDPKIRIVHSVWDDSLREGGRVLAVETNKALDHIDRKADWCFYLQADEVIHEDDYSSIRNAMSAHLEDKRVEGLLFEYVHFYGSYEYFGNSRRWYRHEIRIVRNDPGVRSFRDAQGFRIHDRIMNVKPANARIFHYGWVKDPLHQLEKQKSFHKMWHSDEKVEQMVQETPFDYSGIDSLEIFKGSHPAAMTERINSMDWHFKFDTGRKKLTLKNRILMLLEQKTGKRFFEYKNYRLI